MKIALCDDDGRFRAQTARSLDDILEKRGVTADVAKFRGAGELLAALDEGAEFDFYFLDIVMPEMNGVTLARRIRERFPQAPILFFTTSRDYAVEAFALGAAHYIVKPFTREQFVAAIDRALELLPKKSATSITLKTTEGLLNVAYTDIVYTESDEHYKLVRLTDGRELYVRISGEDLWQALETAGHFVRAGLRFIFNLSHITGIRRNEVTLTGGRIMQVPRRAMADIKAAYVAFCCR